MENLNFKVMMGVIPGYGHENKELTPSNAYRIGDETWREAVEEVSNMQIDPENPESPYYYAVGGKIVPALAVYSKNFGCPVGGEVGIQVESSIGENQDVELYKKSVIETIKVAMAKLSQTTTTIEWANEDKSMGTTYIYEGGKKINENNPLGGIEHFSVSLGDGKNSNEEYVRIGSAIQDAVEKVSSTGTGKGDEKYYIISGIMTPSQDENGGIQFSASQNPIYGQTDNELYRQSIIKTIEQVMRTIGQKSASINFKEETVSLDLEDILKQQNEMGEK